MIQHSTPIRVRYAETDQMGYVYYGCYAEYFEVARAEMVRWLGMPYAQLEREGTLLPVRRLHVEYLKPAHYDDLLRVDCIVRQKPTARIVFAHHVWNERQELLANGEVELVFVDAQTGRPTRAPEAFMRLLEARWADAGPLLA